MAKAIRTAAIRPNPLALAVAAALMPFTNGAQADPAANALPTGGQVTSGTATISQPSTNALQINQASDKAILQWQTFSIGSAASVNFTQPSASSIALNRVLGSNPSEIFGRLTANGQVFLSNPSGVLFGPSASIDVGALFATTLSITDADFLAGNYNFYNAGGAGSVINQGSITASGYAALAGPQVRNDGVIVANSGTVALAAGDRVSLDMVGDGLISVSVDQAAMNASAINAGTIQADGGKVVLTARSANALLDTVVNNSGIIQANSLVARNGEIILDGGSAGVVSNTGTLQAAGVGVGTQGGSITVTGDKVSVANGGVVDASGDTGGGTIVIGRGASATFIGADTTIRADATQEGSGGSVETSGGYLQINSAPQVGAGGSWLIDPFNITLVSGTTSNNSGVPNFTPTGNESQIDVALINSQLNAGANVTVDTGQLGSPGGQAGDITVAAAVTKAVANGSSLTLNAFHDVQINQNIAMASGALTINANRITNNAAVSTTGANTILSADAFALSSGTVNGGTGAVILRPRTGSNSFGIESAGDTTVGNADIASITTSDFVLFGSGQGATFTGNMTIGANAQVNGGTKNLAFFRSTNPGGSITLGANGVTTTGNVIIGAGAGSIVGDGTVAGNQVQLRSTGGAIGSALAPIHTAVNRLALTTNGGGAFISEADGVTLGNVNFTVGGLANNFGNSVGVLNLSAGGPLTVVGAVNSIGGQSISTASIALNAQNGSQAVLRNTGGDQSVTATSGGIDITVGATGGFAQIINNAGAVNSGAQTVQTPGALTISVANGTGVTSGVLQNQTGLQTVNAGSISLSAATSGSGGGAFISNSNNGGGDQQINLTGGGITLKAGAVGSSNRAGIVSSRDQTITGNPDILVTGGDSGTGTSDTLTSNGAFISANAGAQTINAASITLNAGAGGQDTFAAVNAASQVITVVGDVSLNGGGGTGNFNSARIGGPGGTSAGPTNLVLNAHNVSLTGGATTRAGLGSANVGGAQPNTITVNATGDVVLNEGKNGPGAGARIGSADPSDVAGGDITINAANIALNGVVNATAIRTTGNVTLGSTGSVSEAANGAIVATGLTLTAASASLGGGNQIANLNVPLRASPPNAPGVTGSFTLNNTGPLAVTSLRAGGSVTLTNAGALTLNAAGTQDARITSAGGQTISADALIVHAQDGRIANITNTGGNQSLLIGAGGIDLSVAAGSGVAQVANNRGALTNGTQTVQTTGALNVVGGSSVVPGNVNSGIFQMQTGKQTVIAGSILLQAATAAVSNAGAFILNTNTGTLPGGDQEINVAGGTITILGGANGLSNRAGIATLGNQTINGNPDIVLTGGSSGTGAGGTANAAFISANAAGKTQTINAGSITLSAGTGGTDTSATITGTKQVITATGDVSLSGGANTGYGNGARIGGAGGNSPSATDLTLTAHDVLLTAGTTASGAALGSSGNTATPLDNNITINASGSVILNASATNGVRIGTNSDFATPAAGNITVTAGQDIQLNGDVHAAAIRTTGDVTLKATNGAISEGSNGFVRGNVLTATAGTAADLGGPNQVSVFNGASGAAMTLVNAGALSVTGITSGALMLTNTGTVTLDASGTQDARIASIGGQTIAADGLVLHARDGRVASIGNSSGDQTVTIGAGGIDLSVLNGAGAAQIFNNTGTGAQTVQTTGAFNVLAGAMPNTSSNSGVFQFQSGTQTVSAASVALHGSDSGSNGGAFITNSNGGGGQVVQSNGAITITAGGSLGSADRAGIFSSGNQTIAAGDITLTGGANGSSNLGLSNSAQISTNGAVQTINAANISVNAGTAGTDTFATITAAKQFITATGDVRINGGGGIGAGNGARIGGTSGPTDLTLAANNVVLTAGATTGVGLGSMSAGVQPNTVNVHAAGDVVLNSTPGAGARIGSGTGGVAAGDIAVMADGSILLNGVGRSATIRTSGNVTLDAGTAITELGTGMITAGTLTATTRGTALLTGANVISTLNVPLVGTAPGVARSFTLNNSGPLTITNLFAGGAVTLTNAGAISMNAGGTSDAIVSSVGGQTISADALLVHVQDGRLARIINNGGAQAIGAGAGGINLEVVDGRGSAQIVNARGAVTNGTQDVSTTGLLNVAGGSTSNGSGAFNSGVFQAQTGKQTVSAGSIALQAAVAPVSTGGALIINTDGGSSSDQEVNVASGTIRLTGGGVGLNNRAGIQTSGNQLISGNADIFLTGGSSGSGTNNLGTANSALITAGKTQTISAHDITLQAGSGGTDTFAAIVANTQKITATGDVRLTGGANSGDAAGARIGASGNTATGTNLELTAHNVVITGGTTTAAGIGNSAAAVGKPNTIKITATGDVILNSGAGNGARIGSPNGDTGAGSISITANGRIALNPDDATHASSIRTAGDVTLNAASISEAANGQILANSLALTTSGQANLGGSNQISSLSATTGGAMTLANTGTLAVSGITAAGALTLTNSGALTLSASGTHDVVVSSVGGQTINAQGLAVTADGGTAQLSNFGGDQSITVSGGPSAAIDVRTLAGGGFASISNNGGGSQSIALLNGDHINVDGAFGGAAIFAFGGSQALSATGTGRNAITVGSAGALGPSNVASSVSQSVTAGLAGESGSITIVGSAAPSALAGFVTNPVPGGTQTISTSGEISITGGSAAAQLFNFPAGIFHNGSGAQTINAAGIALSGGNAGNGNAALINSSGGGNAANAGDQVINVTGGNITITAGSVGSGNRAGIVSSGNQTINGNPDIVVTGGADGSGTASTNTSNGAFISANIAGRTQTINGGKITINAGAGGSDTFATINGANQVIHATGDVVLNGGGGFGAANGARIGGPGGGSTNLTLSANNVILNGGTTTGVGLGSSISGTAQPNTITVNATEDVVLNEGTGVGSRIGSGSNGVAAGDISVHAGGNIALNGTTQPTAIRTTGNVELQAGGAITEGSDGFIIANALTTVSGGSTLLGGANQISIFNATSGGDVLLDNTGVLDVTGLSAVGNATLDNVGNVTISGPWSAGGTTSITVHSDLLIDAPLSSHDVVLTATSGSIQESAGGSIDADSLTTSSVGDTRLDGDNTVSSFSGSSDTGTVSLTNSGPLTVTTPIDTLTIAAAGDLNLTHSMNATHLVLRSATGDITVGGATAAEATVLYAADSLTISAPGQVLVRGSDCTPGAGSYLIAGGVLDVQAGSFSLVGGAASFAPAVAAGNVVNVSTTGNVTLTGGSGWFSPVLLLGGSAIDLTVGGTLKIDGGSGFGSFARVQTATRDGQIHITFANESGEYVVDGLDGRIKHGQDGFYTGLTPARLGDSLTVEYSE